MDDLDPMDDLDYMKRVLKLAKKGSGRVSPNPMVGAVVVKHGRILSEGYHRVYGEPHAEVIALSKLGDEEKKNATLYVNLEPCNHHGKTPPCTDAIIDSGVRRVVIGCLDPNPGVKGGGQRRLRESGIDVTVGVREDECKRLNDAFFKCTREKKPFITLKIAQTLDGKIATSEGHSRWITSTSSRRRVHHMRKECDAVLIGIGTVIQDDPLLNVRWTSGASPKRVILDSKLCISLDARILHHPDVKDTIIVTTAHASGEALSTLRKTGASVWVLEEDVTGKVSLPSLWRRMASEGLCNVLVEGGKTVFSSLLRAGDVDRIVVFIAPKLFGEGKGVFENMGIRDPAEAITFKEIRWRRLGQDMVFEGRL